jgi:hypothetical protein
VHFPLPFLFLLCCTFAACGAQDLVLRGPGDGGAADASVGVDAGMPDAGVGDAGVADAGPRDAGAADAGAADASFVDAGVVDAGAVDAGAVDAGQPDASVRDAGACVPSCTARACGEDGCGGVCGVCAGETLCALNGQCVPFATPPNGGLEVGVDYHATDADFSTAFLTRYDDGAVRATVQQQLRDFADGGVTVISTRVWLVTDPAATGAPAWQHHFPPTARELSLLTLYAQDVAAAGLKLYVHPLYLWCAEYEFGTPATTLGHCGHTATTFVTTLRTSLTGILDAVKGVRRPDGRPVVERYYLDGEVLTAAGPTDSATQWEKANQRWLLKDTGTWQWFVTQTRRAGLIPSLYFLHEG